MAKQLIIHGKVQGVFCRAYCSQYARKLRIHGSATNMANGTVRVLLNTDDVELVRQYISNIENNPDSVIFYGKIQSIDVKEYAGSISGDYQF